MQKNLVPPRLRIISDPYRKRFVCAKNAQTHAKKIFS